MDEAVAYVGIGSNLDDPERQVRSAIEALDGLDRSRRLRASRLFRTAPWGDVDQPAFVNAAAAIATRLSPRDLLGALLAIERAHGRTRDGTRWGPRVIDLDVLLYGDRRVDEPGLSIPHPRLGERAFALLPLADLDPGLVVPGQGRVRELLARIGTAGCMPLAESGAA
ncbi:MAG TPA: 2-amino-4-hydroxy-6-hydroxymethyldihydropteridine diphosphokinase [Rhodanobacteraceae bacterium]|jgi:2-amino-4-hydroxy-6-hydroxymethyldihydropteridine diphosphokinase|nr:2-amino-4-hydroxy-6-hydroxymethyldihydropteridine diphosphokinase [Rhodanobacteraceae bacterium]